MCSPRPDPREGRCHCSDVWAECPPERPGGPGGCGGSDCFQQFSWTSVVGVLLACGTGCPQHCGHMLYPGNGPSNGEGALTPTALAGTQSWEVSC